MRACIAKRKHEDDGEQRADRADLRPRIDPESGNEQERRGIARPLASKSMTPADAPTSDDSDSDSETYYEESSSDESDEEDSEGDESEKDEPEREIVIGRQPASIVTSYEDAESGATVLRAGSKPNIDMSFGKNSSLLSRVRAFLPELEASNRVLVTESSEGPHSRKLELDDDEALDQPHVEMVGPGSCLNTLLTASEHIRLGRR